jgi:hypothetical protein
MPTGWRVWGVDRAGRLGRAFFHTGPQVWGTGWLEAECRRGHQAPAPECWCGLHLMTEGDDVWAFVRARYRPGVSARPVAVGRVEYDGAALRSLIPGDPASTLRVERARVLGPVVLPPAAEPFAAAIRDRYRVPVYDQTQHELHRVLWGTG